jgi:hypothetical protein
MAEAAEQKGKTVIYKGSKYICIFQGYLRSERIFLSNNQSVDLSNNYHKRLTTGIRCNSEPTKINPVERETKKLQVYCSCIKYFPSRSI